MPNFQVDFRDKVVIVTGGAKGIGHGLCTAFAKAGARVLCVDVDAAAGKALAQEARAIAGQVIFQRADVSKSGPCKKLVDKVVNRWGGVDILCNNVGIQPTDSYLATHELPEEMWDRIIDVNLKSAFLMSKYCIPHMQRQGGGVIINTASVQGLQSANLVPAYAASKGGILSLTRQMALDYAKDNIRVLAVNPGTIDTPMVAEAAAAAKLDLDEQRRIWGAAHPLGRIGQPAEIANAVLFLASDAASFMTGENICVDGGMMAKGAWA